MKYFFSLIALFLFSTNTWSQAQNYQSVQTSPTGGRYEIIQSGIQRRLTFKIDKYTGHVYQFVSTMNDWFAWEEVPKDTTPLDIITPNKINYQLFLGGLAAKDCFLLNINTGTTWVLVEDKKGYKSFQKFE